MLETVGQDLHRDKGYRHGLGNVDLQRLDLAGDVDPAFGQDDAWVGADVFEELAEVDFRTVVGGVVQEVMDLGECKQSPLDVLKPRDVPKLG
jgi:hypothetical protein